MIRSATLEDQAQVYQLIQQLETYSLEVSHFNEVYSHMIESNEWFVFVEDDNGQLLGVITVMLKDFLHHNHKTAEIVELIVDQNHRNHHIGEKLIHYTEDTLNPFHIEELELCTSLWRKDAHRFYKRVGFINNHYNFIKKL